MKIRSIIIAFFLLFISNKGISQHLTYLDLLNLQSSSVEKCEEILSKKGFVLPRKEWLYGALKDDLMKYRVANALGGNNGGSGNLGDGLSTGAGLAMGMNMAKMINEGMNSNQSDEITNKLKKLKELLDLGAINQEEFEKKKQEYLNKL
jgi:hypothetical protein